MEISIGRVEQCNYFPWARISAYIVVLGQGASMKVIMIACNLYDKILTEPHKIVFDNKAVTTVYSFVYSTKICRA